MIGPLQTAVGGDPAVVMATIILLVVTAVSSLAVAWLIVQGYRQNRDSARLFLAIGLVLLTAGPIVSQLVLTNATAVSSLGRAAVANTSKLCGLAAMVYAIYVVPRRADR